MKKKLICLALSLIMLLSVCLTGCGNKTDEEIQSSISKDASLDARTLSLYLVSEKAIDEKTEKRIEEAVNNITETKFKTRLDLRFYTEDQYYAMLDSAFTQRLANGAPALVYDESENDQLIRYPNIPDYQVDIFYLGGLDNYTRYLKSGYLAKLDDSIKNASKELNEIMTPLYFNTLKNVTLSSTYKGIYAVPNNHAIGEYTYLLLNKEALSRANEVSTGFTSLTSERCQEFLAYINDSASMSADFVPLWTEMTEVEALLTNLQTWGVADDGSFTEEFSIIGSYYTSADDLTAAATQSNMISNLFNNETFVKDLRVLTEYRTGGYYAGAEDADKPFAVGLVQGGAELAEIYGDEYEMIVIEEPRMTTEDLYGNMFAISNYSTDIERCMEIITYLNTDVEFRNLLQYGIEGEDYQLIDSKVEKNEFGETYKVAKRTGDSYLMDVNKTGNVFISYPLQTDEMESINEVILSIHEYGVQQNKDVANKSMTLSFVLNYDATAGAYVNREWMQAVQTLSESILQKYNALTDVAQFDAFVETAKADIAACAEAALLLPRSNTDTHNLLTCGGKCGALTCYHMEWMRAYMSIALTINDAK